MSIEARAADGRAFHVEDLEPAYLRVFREGGMAARVEAALRELKDCHACPRNCGCNRLENETRACHTGRFAIVSTAFAHFGEEDCVRGTGGSEGTVRPHDEGYAAVGEGPSRGRAVRGRGWAEQSDSSPFKSIGPKMPRRSGHVRAELAAPR